MPDAIPAVAEGSAPEGEGTEDETSDFESMVQQAEEGEEAQEGQEEAKEEGEGGDEYESILGGDG